jgi:endopolyphosphatase
VEQNELLVTKFVEVFGKDDNINDTDPTNDFTIPIVPTFGNNDMMPHKIFEAGPNKWTLKYLKIWRNFIPEAQRHQFQRGGWFYVEVIPNNLAVISMNTMYFFDSNSAVDGCADKSEPGYEHMDWLRIQLQFLRDRGMKAILMGHVPPARTDNKLSWDETCWQKYSLWMRQYRDVIVGSLYGHMNIDHFMLQDFKDIGKDTKAGKMEIMNTRVSMLEDGEITTASASDYLIDLRDEWAQLPSPPSPSMAEYTDGEGNELSTWEWILESLRGQKKSNKKKKGGKGDKGSFLDKIGGPWGERFSVSHISASVVPNYFPTLRVFEYNITGLEDLVIPDDAPLSGFQDDPQVLFKDESPSFLDGSVELSRKKKGGEEKGKIKKPKKYKFVVPAPPSKSAPPGPAYSPQTFSLTGYAQYFANLTHINNDFVDQEPGHVDAHKMIGAERWKQGKHQGKKSKHQKPHPKQFEYQVEYNTTDDKIFKLQDLTVRSYLDLARRIGEYKQKGQEFLEEQKYECENEEEVEHDNADAEKKGKDKKKNKNKKNKKKKHGKHGKTTVWFTFVKRAFVGTLDPDLIEEEFGSRVRSSEEISDSIMASPEL